MKKISPWIALLALLAFSAVPAYAAPSFSGATTLDEEDEGDTQIIAEDCEEEEDAELSPCDEGDGDDEGASFRPEEEEEEEEGDEESMVLGKECDGDDDGDHDEEDDDSDEE